MSILQLAIRFGLLPTDLRNGPWPADLQKVREAIHARPWIFDRDYFKKENLTTLEVEQIASWDETHLEMQCPATKFVLRAKVISLNFHAIKMGS